MKVFVKTLKGSHFEIEVNPDDTVADVKKNIERSQGQNVYPADQLMLIHQGKVLKDPTTLAENNVAENSFVVVMLSKAKAQAPQSGASSTPVAPIPSQATSARTITPAAAPVPAPALVSLPAPAAAPIPSPAPFQPATILPQLPVVTGSTTVSAAPAVRSVLTDADPYNQAASNLVAGSKIEEAVQHILDIGGGTWDRETVVRALRAAFNNPERAIEYLYSGIPEQAEVPRAAPAPPAPAANPPPPVQPTVPSGGPNANPLDLFPQGLPNVGIGNAPGNNLDFLRSSPQFRALQSMVQANPHILQPMLQELAKQNPQLMRLIQEHQADFVRLINEPAEGGEGNLLSQLASAVPQSVQVTQEEREAIERLEALGFDRTLVLEVFFACNKNEELAANYLLDHMHEFD